MMLPSKIAVCLLACLGGSNIASAASLPQISKRDTISASLYAYGTNITGLEVSFVNGLAYVGKSRPAFANLAANITFSTNPSNTSAPWTLTAHNTTSNVTSQIDGSYLYIIPTAGSTAQVGFIPSNETAPTGAVTTGFTWFGTQVAYAPDESTLEMQFWAVVTNTSGLWSLVWNADGAAIGDATPVALKKSAPVILDRDD